jgi:hypothetical protein
MLALRDLQAAFARALLADDAGPVTALIAGDGLAAEERLDIYRNNVFASLTEVLRDTFPAVCRLLDERFFAYAGHDFIRRRPPRRAVLAEYGAQFATFLAGFAPASGLVYLPDVARLEWLMANCGQCRGSRADDGRGAGADSGGGHATFGAAPPPGAGIHRFALADRSHLAGQSPRRRWRRDHRSRCRRRLARGRSQRRGRDVARL